MIEGAVKAKENEQQNRSAMDQQRKRDMVNEEC